MNYFETVRKVREDATTDIASYVSKSGDTTIKNCLGIHRLLITVKEGIPYFGVYTAEDVKLEVIVLVADMFNQMLSNEKDSRSES